MNSFELIEEILHTHVEKLLTHHHARRVKERAFSPNKSACSMSQLGLGINPGLGLAKALGVVMVALRLPLPVVLFSVSVPLRVAVVVAAAAAAEAEKVPDAPSLLGEMVFVGSSSLETGVAALMA